MVGYLSGHIDRRASMSSSRCSLIVTEISRMNTWRDRRKELRQLALHVSSVEELLEVVEITVTVMRKHWSEAISTFEDKFRSLSTLLLEHGKFHHPRFILYMYILTLDRKL